MYVANRGDQGEWHGPFPSFDAAIADADAQVFGD
jgi:hypothetical protein